MDIRKDKSGKKDIDIDFLFDNFDKFPLLIALESKNFSLAKILLENGANIHLETPKTQKTLLDIFADKSNLEVVKFLIKSSFLKV